MATAKSSMIILLALALGGIAIAAPARHDSFDNRARSTDQQVDKAALFRATNVGECAAIQRQGSGPTARQRDAKQARTEQRKTLANAGCSVVWSD